MEPSPRVRAEDENPLIDAHRVPLSLAELKVRFLSRQLQKQKEELCVRRPVSVSLVTWNVSGREPTPAQQGEIDSLLPSAAVDVLAFGLQEVDRRPEAYVSAVKTREANWNRVFQEALQAREGWCYVRVSSQIMVGVLVSVWVREGLLEHVSQVSSTFASCGIMGVVGNKGGVAVRFKLFDDYVCIVNCHLAAHEDQVLRRNQDFSDLHDRLRFSSVEGREGAVLNRHEHLLDPLLFLRQSSVLDCDVLLWMGDFNYRVEMDNDLVRAYVVHGQYHPVLERDQLNQQKERHALWSRYAEPGIAFAPSYRYNIGTDEFDSSEKQRVPSWCDRIIWRRGDAVGADAYESIMLPKMSDHKPVRLVATVNVCHVQAEKYDAAYSVLLKKMDAFENAAIPDTCLSTHFVDFGVLGFQDRAVSSFKVINKGATLAQYRFVPTDGDEGHFPWWVRSLNDESEGIVLPGHEAEIHLSAVYDIRVAQTVANAGKSVEAIVVLHVEGGRDHFVTLGFEARRTVFGHSLQTAIIHPFMLDRNHPSKTYRVPTPVWRLVDFVVHAGRSVDNLFLLAASAEVDKCIISCLDSNEPFPASLDNDMGVIAAGQMLLLYLEALPTPLIDNDVADALVHAIDGRLLEKLPERNLELLEYLTAFIGYKLMRHNKSLTPHMIATVLSRVVFDRRYLKNRRDARALILILEQLLMDNGPWKKKP